MMNAHEIGFVLSDTRGKILEVNRTFARMLGYTREEILSGAVDWRKLTPSDQRHLSQWAIAEVKRSGTHSPFGKEYLHKDGRRVLILVQTIYLQKGGGLYIGLFTELSRNELAQEKGLSKLMGERAIQEREEMREQPCSSGPKRVGEIAFDSSYQEALANLARLIVPLFPVGICLLDQELKYTHINSVLAAINGYSIEQHLGRKFRDLLPTYAAQYEPLIQNVLETGKPVLNLEISGEIPGKPEYHARWLCNYYPIQADSGQTVGVSVTVTEINRFKPPERSFTLQFSV